MLPGTRDGRTVQVGDALPELAIEVTATVIVAGAIATRDFMPVHHDRDYAQQQGSPDIFMNILSDGGHVSRYLTDWGGPDCMVKRLAMRLGVPLFPGATLTFSGSVTSVEPAGDDVLVGVEFVGRTHLGDHVSGTAAVLLPTS